MGAYPLVGVCFRRLLCAKVDLVPSITAAPSIVRADYHGTCDGSEGYNIRALAGLVGFEITVFCIVRAIDCTLQRGVQDRCATRRF